MEFRPCIDIHNGQVKQIVGSSLRDASSAAMENFVSTQSAADYARLYAEMGITGGHVILLNPASSSYYEATKSQALAALAAYPGGLQVGGGITTENADEFLDAGASHVIVTSHVFRDGLIRYDRLETLARAVGRKSLVLDLSCRKVDGAYRIVTDRWQNITKEILNASLLTHLSAYADEFLVHGVDVEGKQEGIEKELVRLLADWGGIPITYAGGVRSWEDLKFIKEAGNGRLHVTIGSALDLFGGTLSLEEILRYIRKDEAPHSHS
jgi:phosphoribosylformimino-5-aminoimidazole carboxamide ribotide isomerase